MPTTEQQISDAITFGTPYPPNITAQHLAATATRDGLSQLHRASANGHFPPGTTPADLANCRDQYDWSALHVSAANFFILPGTTTKLLQTTLDYKGRSAWDALCTCLKTEPRFILNISPVLFANEHPCAIAITNSAIEENPSLQTQVTLWLGQVLAQTHPEPKTRA